MGRILLFGLVAMIGMIDQAMQPKIVEPPRQVQLAEEVSFIEDVSLAIDEAVNTSQPAAPAPVAPYVVPEAIPLEELQVATVATEAINLPCADGSCSRGGRVVTAPVRWVANARENAKERRVDRRDNRRDRFASCPGLFRRRC